MTRHILRFAWAALALLACSAALAAEIETKAEPTLRLSGPLRQGDAEKLREVLTALVGRQAQSKSRAAATFDRQITVELSSLGGDLQEGLRIGYLFREFNVATVVRKNDVCLSACALAFLGGAVRSGLPDRAACRRLEIGGKVGFHSFWLNPNSAEQPTADDQVRARQQGFTEALSGAAAVVRYAADLGIDQRFIAGMLGKPSEAFAYIDTVADFLTLNICPSGLDRPPVGLAQQAANICGHATGWANRAKSSQVVEISPKLAKRYILENVQQNMLLHRVNGALSSQLASYAVMRDGRAIDTLYADLQAAGVRLPTIVGPVFEIDGYQIGEGETQCFVSLSLDNPDRFEVAVRRPKIWAHPAHSPPRDCRRLFLYDRHDVVNPRP
jgi:hypothetical protein